MSDLGLLAYYLGIEVTQTNGDISIKQSVYTSKILKEAGMIDCNETLIPMDPGTRLTKITEETMVNSMEYQSLIGCLRYLLHTRPDLSYSVGLLSLFIECVEREDIQVDFVSGEYQKADILTKALPKIKFLTMRQLIERYLQIVASIEQYSDLKEMTLEEAVGRLKTYKERIKYKKGTQVDSQDKLMFTRHENKYFRGRGRGKHKFSQGRNHEHFKEERKEGEISHKSYNKNNFKKTSYDTSKLRCYECKNLGHIAPKCPLRTNTNEQSNLVEEDVEPTLLMAILEVEEKKVSLNEEDVGYKETDIDGLSRMETIRLLLAIAANNKWEVHHLDVKSTFLHGDLKEEVYITQPEGFIKKQDQGKVYRLIKALYGLRQAPRAWNIKLDNTLKSLDFKKCALEQAIYTKRSKDSTQLIGIYVDDLIITSTPKKGIDKFKAQIEEKFKMSDLGLLAYYLGIEVTQTNGDISIKQSAYGSKILKEAGMIDCNETLIPMDPGTRLTKITEETMVNSMEYQSLIGCLRYLLRTRPDLTATQALWLKRLLSKLAHSQEEKVTIQVDIKSAIALMKNPVFHGRSKHIDTKYHFIRECVEREDIQVDFVSREYQKADILTKVLPKIKFLTMRQLIGLKDLSHNAYD
nr:ribonuclease H-like domain, reverse transcriptase, RNA-dependent DNA polymerase [Tanacetum cinerariifolium]